jgi:hypothetical protein
MIHFPTDGESMMVKRFGLLLLALTFAVSLSFGALHPRINTPGSETEEERPRLTDVNAAFKAWNAELPEPATLSQMNGFCVTCASHGTVTYTLLDACRDRLNVTTANLPDLLRWSRHADPCMRFIALSALAKQTGYEAHRDGLSVPVMFDPEHWMYAENIAWAKRYLDSQRAKYDREIFVKLLLNLDKDSFRKYMEDTWEEAVNSKQMNFQYEVVVVGKVLTLRHKYLKTDKFPDATKEFAMGAVRPEDPCGFKVENQYERDRIAGRDPGEWRVSKQTYFFLPITKDLMWFWSESGIDHTKLFRAKRSAMK